MERTKNIIMYVTTMMVQIMGTIGGAGLIATGAYMLNSFLGLAQNAQDWQYGLTGIAYILFMLPSLITAEKMARDFYLN